MQRDEAHMLPRITWQCRRGGERGEGGEGRGCGVYCSLGN